VTGLQIEVTEWTMEMRDRGDLRTGALPGKEMSFSLAEAASPDLNRALYAAVGAPVCWTDRFGWTHADWADWVSRPQLATWIAMAEGTVAGFFELEAQPGGDTEVHLVGLVPVFVGAGFGGYLVEQCVRRAWQRGELWAEGSGPARRVHLRTSTLDHPNAKLNYLCRGFTIADERTWVKSVPDPRSVPWPLPADPRRDGLAEGAASPSHRLVAAPVGDGAAGR
jgi:GNAT superfamily N-acetyltransferase